MHRISHFIVPAFFVFLLSCTPDRPLQTSLIVYRFDPPAFLEFSENFQLTQEIPFPIPPNCGLFDTFPAPTGSFLIIELSCPNGQTVLFMDTTPSPSTDLETASISQPISNADSHFLAWSGDGEAAFLKVDSLGHPQIIRAYPDGTQEFIPVTEFTYDLSTKPNSQDFIFTFSRGFGYGSELYLAQRDGRVTRLLYADLYNYISYARFSPDGKRIAFIKTPDTQTPFTVGELWVIPSTVTFTNRTPSSELEGKFIAHVDTGHGYAANWSPDGTKIAYVVRENPEDKNADTSSEALISNIYIIEVESEALTQVTKLTDGYTETPFWSPDGNTLAFNVVINGRMQMHIVDIDSKGVGSSNPLSPELENLRIESICCPAWMRK